MKCANCNGTGMIVDTDVMTGDAVFMCCTYCFGRKESSMKFEEGKWYKPKRELRMSYGKELAFSPAKAYQCKYAKEAAPGSSYESAIFHSEIGDGAHFVASCAGGWWDEFVEASVKEVLATILLAEIPKDE